MCEISSYRKSHPDLFLYPGRMNKDPAHQCIRFITGRRNPPRILKTGLLHHGKGEDLRRDRYGTLSLASLAYLYGGHFTGVGDVQGSLELVTRVGLGSACSWITSSAREAMTAMAEAGETFTVIHSSERRLALSLLQRPGLLLDHSSVEVIE